MARAPRVELVEGEEVDGEAVCVRRRTPARARDARVSVSRDGQSEALSAKRARATRCSPLGCGGRHHQENELVDRGFNRRRRERPPVSTGTGCAADENPQATPKPAFGHLGAPLAETPHASDARGCPPRRFAHVQPRALDARASHRRRGRWDAIPRKSPRRRRVAAAAAPSTTPTTSGRRASPPSPAKSPAMR